MKNRKVLRSSSIQSYRKEEKKEQNNTPINHESMPQNRQEGKKAQNNSLLFQNKRLSGTEMT